MSQEAVTTNPEESTESIADLVSYVELATKIREAADALLANPIKKPVVSAE